MPKFEIVLGAYRYEQNTMEVEADTLEEAIATAYRDDDCEYEAGDLSESFISEVRDETGADLDFPDAHRDPNMDPVQLRRAAPALLAALKAVLACPQAAPWLARIEFGKSNLFAEAAAVVAAVDGHSNG